MENRETEEVPLSFEAALQRWEEVVGLLERGSLTLEESLQLYEEGMRLRDLCYARLSEAEGKMKILRQAANGTVVEEEPEG
jgi:exodeoxyribonuclease VII small subunit